MALIPLQTRTLYAELLDRLRARRAAHGLKDLPGTFVEKTVNGKTYLYFQHLDPGGARRQTYVGPYGGRLAELAKRFKDERPDSAREDEQDEMLCAQLRAGGAAAPDSPTARVLRAFADAGVFAADAILVGTHAFSALGTALGWRWDAAAGTTLDIDLASVQLAVTDAAADLPDALKRLEMGFLPVPALDPRSPSTAFKVRGGALRVDLVTPMKGRPDEEPVYIPKLRAHASPLQFLDFLIEDAMDAGLPNGAGILVRVPTPARFAVHKLVVSVERTNVDRAKSAKDLRQAADLAAALTEEGLRGDLRAAAKEFASRGPGWARRLKEGASRLEKAFPGTGKGWV